MSELRLISRHAGTILVGQLAVMAFGVADTVIAGRHSEATLAALWHPAKPFGQPGQDARPECDKVVMDRAHLATSSNAEKCHENVKFLSSTGHAVLLCLRLSYLSDLFRPQRIHMSRRHFVVALATAAVVAGCAYGQPAVSVTDTLTAQARLSTLNSLAAKTTETLARLFDEAPVALSLAGLIAVRYTFEVLNALDGRLIG